MKKVTVNCLSVAMLLSLCACSENFDNQGIVEPGSENTATVRVSLGVEGVTASRADDNAAPAEIGDGTRATTLIYGLYKKEANGTYTALKIDGVPESFEGSNYQVVLTDVKFPYTDLSFDLVKGFEYVMAFWAQSPEAFDKKYFDTSDLSAIKINYDDIDNNDELRDAFCAKYELKVTQSEENVSVMLKRPFAQINVGISPKSWDLLRKNWKQPVSSAISFSGVCDTYNLLTGTSVYDNVSSLKTVEFQAATIPHSDDYAYNTTKFLQIDMNHDGKYTPYTDENPEQFYWVSMCYVLVPDYVGVPSEDGETIYSTTIDLTKLDLNYAAYDKIDPVVEAGTLNPDPVNNLPVLRNHRTNLILDGWPFVTKNVIINLDNMYDGDMPNTDESDKN